MGAAALGDRSSEPGAGSTAATTAPATKGGTHAPMVGALSTTEDSARRLFLGHDAVWGYGYKKNRENGLTMKWFGAARKEGDESGPPR